jgi:uncharacterized protein (TIGR03437 family)
MSPNSASNPAAPGSIIVLYASGEGQTSPGGVDGEIAGTSAPQPVQRVLVSIGTAGAQILYAGGVPGLVASVIQVNARIPLGTGPANLPVTITVGSANSQVGITIAVSK